jgi:hypothetical protein
MRPTRERSHPRLRNLYLHTGDPCPVNARQSNDVAGTVDDNETTPRPVVRASASAAATMIRRVAGESTFLSRLI